MTSTIWGIHMEREHGEAPITDGYIAIGWREMGDLSKYESREDYKQAVALAYPERKAGAIPVYAGTMFRFVHEMKIGDKVVYPSKQDRMVNLGVVDSGYEFDPVRRPSHPNRRRVRWIRRLSRSAFSQSALYEIGSAVTLFQVSSHFDEFSAAFEGSTLEAGDIDDATSDVISAQVEESTEDFIIKRLKTAQTAYQFEHFIAHLMSCMGYRARVTKASGDGGIDVIAHKDELGFEPPIIKIQVKQVLDTVGRPAVQQLHGSIEHGEHGLFVTLGSFSSDARAYERMKPNLKLVDGAELIELIYTHYHQFEPRYQMLLPLRRVYVPGAVFSSE